MKTKYTRRRFIQMTIQFGGTVSVAGFSILPDLPLADAASINCRNCKATGKMLHTTSSSNRINSQFCPNCGIDLYLNSYPLEKECNCSAATSEALKKNGEQMQPPCCQVPFPGQQLAGCRNKPIFNITDLKF
jgi:hypothetical protein